MAFNLLSFPEGVFLAHPNNKKQEIGEGVGPAFHRVYRIELPVSVQAARDAMVKLKADINSFSPRWLARFEKTEGEDGPLRPGDCFQIHLPGPWNGPVRVENETENSFRLVTLEGHLEAGVIDFAISPLSEDRVCFSVESVARSHDRLVDLVYDKVPVARYVQTEMWERFCEAFAKAAMGIGEDNGEAELPKVEVTTEKTDDDGFWVPA